MDTDIASFTVDLDPDNDPLYPYKAALHQVLGPLPNPPTLAHALAHTRCVQLNQLELEQLQSPDHVYNLISPRNEAAAIANLVTLWHSAGPSPLRNELLQQLQHHTDAITKQLQHLYTQPPHDDGDDDDTRTTNDTTALPSTTPALLDYVQQHAVNTTTTHPAMIGNDAHRMRGLVCGEKALHQGDTVIAVPESLLLHDGLAADSDLGAALARFDLDPETLTVIWTLLDSIDHESPHAPFWADLPAVLHSGLTMPEALVNALAGTPVHAKLMTARAHITDAHARVLPILQALHAAHPEHVPEESICLEKWIWACALWYSYGMQVEFPGCPSTSRACLVPYASYCNHSIWPHIVFYGTLHPGSPTNSMRFATFRTIHPQEQVYLGYGAKSNADLLVYYGFAVEHNPYDVLELQVPSTSKAESGTAIGSLREQAMQHLQLPGTYSLGRQRTLPPALQTHAAVLAADEGVLREVLGGPVPPGPWARPPQLDAYLPAALKLLVPAVSRMASQLQLDHARVALEEVAGDPGIVQACRVYIAGLQEVLDVVMEVCK